MQVRELLKCYCCVLLFLFLNYFFPANFRKHYRSTSVFSSNDTGLKIEVLKKQWEEVYLWRKKVKLRYCNIKVYYTVFSLMFCILLNYFSFSNLLGCYRSQQKCQLECVGLFVYLLECKHAFPAIWMVKSGCIETLYTLKILFFFCFS